MNETKVAAGWTMGFNRDARELIVVAVKATFEIPQPGGEAVLADAQVPLIEADEFSDDPGQSAPMYEADYAHRKPRCDVLLNGTAYAPRGYAQRRVAVRMTVGPMTKIFNVCGPRTWRRGLYGWSASEPAPFVASSISYDSAFGGTDWGDGKSEIKTYLENPVGCGYSPYGATEGVELPNTEEVGRPIGSPFGAYKPMAFGSIGRNWLPRVGFAGTYDQIWLEDRFPFWPRDFDERYFQAAPPVQQISYPGGGEEMILSNLTPDGHVSFRLPVLSMPVTFVPYKGPEFHEKAVIDTIMIEPDLGRFTMTWRISKPMRRSCFDMRQVIVGTLPDAWYRSRRLGNKPYYRSLADLVSDRVRSR